MRNLRAVAIVLLFGLAIAACGARLNPQTRAQAAAAQLNASGGGGSALGSGTTTGPGGTTTGPGGTTTGPGGSTTTTGGGGTTPTGGGGTTTTGGGNTTGNGQTSGASGNCPTSGTDTGLTANSVLLGTIASTTGPVSGLFAGANQGMQAFRAYMNSLGGICGHTVSVQSADDGTNCQQNQNDAEDLGGKTFALVGSFSLYDGCSADYIAQHKIPDLHVQLDPKAGAVPTNYDMEPGPLGYATGPFAYYKKKYGAAVQAVGTLYPNIPSAVAKQHAFEHAAESQGWKIVYSRAVDATENDWATDFVKMCKTNRPTIKIFFTAAENANYAAKMVQDEKQAGCPSSLINIIPIAYDQAFPQDVGNNSLIEGLQGWNEYSLFFNQDEAQRIPELKLLQSWFQQANGNQPLNLYALFAWAEGRLFQQAFENAGKVINRQTLLASLAKIHNFSANGIMAPVDPGSKSEGPKCYVLWQFHNGKYERVDDPPNGTGYRCDGTYLKLNG